MAVCQRQQKDRYPISIKIGVIKLQTQPFTSMAKKFNFPKKSKGSSTRKVDKILQEQTDFYEEGVELEELAERWVLSDIKKTLNFYYQAVTTYNAGLQCTVNRSDKISYNIAYNRLTLLLKLQSEYKHVNGDTDILVYVVGLAPDLLQMLFPENMVFHLLGQFDELMVLSESNSLATWDLYYNYFTAILLFLSTRDSYMADITGAEIVQLLDKFSYIFKKLVDHHVEFFDSVQPNIMSDEEKTRQEFLDYPNLEKDELLKSSSFDVNTGEGIKLANNSASNDQNDNTDMQSQNMSEVVESSSSMSWESYFDTLNVANTFVNEILELIISHDSTEGSAQLSTSDGNDFQKNYILVNMNKLHLQIIGLFDTAKDSLQSSSEPISAKDPTEELTLSLRYTDYLTHYSEYSYLWNKSNEVDPQTCNSSDYLLNEIDFLRLVCNLENVATLFTPDERWNMATKLDKTLVRAIQLISKEKSSIATGLIKGRDNELSPLTTTLSRLYIRRSENELNRLDLQKQKYGNLHTSLQDLQEEQQQQKQIEAVEKTIRVLQKNVVMLCNNAMNVAKQSCGVREYINDKLVRNSVYQEATELQATINFQ